MKKLLKEGIIIIKIIDKKDHQISVRRPDQEKKKTSHIVDFAIPADHCVKMKEREKINKHFDLARELEKL